MRPAQPLEIGGRWDFLPTAVSPFRATHGRVPPEQQITTEPLVTYALKYLLLPLERDLYGGGANKINTINDDISCNLKYTVATSKFE